MLRAATQAATVGSRRISFRTQCVQPERRAAGAWVAGGRRRALPGSAARDAGRVAPALCVSLKTGSMSLRDHSRYGTFLNGHRIDGSAVLQTGDLIRIGTPGFELRLISAEDHGGS